MGYISVRTDVEIDIDEFTVDDAIEILENNNISKRQSNAIRELIDESKTSFTITNLGDEMKLELLVKTFDKFTQDEFEDFLKSKNIFY